MARAPRLAMDAALAVGLLAWTGVQIDRARTELQDRPEVHGPHRVWRPPVDEGPFGGQLIDPRDDTLATELAARYGLSAPPSAPDTVGAGDGSAPRLIWPAPGRPALVVGAWGGDLIVFLPGLGTAVADPARLPADVPAARLDVPHERPF